MGYDPTSTLFGMAGFRVLAVDEHDGGVNVLVELERAEAACPGCGTFSARVKQRPVVRLADTPAGGRKVRVYSMIAGPPEGRGVPNRRQWVHWEDCSSGGSNG